MTGLHVITHAAGYAPRLRSATARARRASPMDLLAIIVTVAMLAALAELMIFAVRKFWFHDTLHASAAIVWMTPAALLLVMLVVMLPLLLLAHVVSERRAIAIAASVALFFGGSGVLLALRGISVPALAVLGIGIAVQGGAMVARHWERLRPGVRRGAVALGTVVGLLGVCVEAGRALWERRFESTLAPAPEQSPNVLLIILDTVRAMSLNLYGYDRATAPNITRLAEGGVTFDYAIVPATWTVPSHGSILTGRWPRELGQWWKTHDAPFPTLSSVLRDRGYRTGGFIGNWYHVNRESGLSYGFTHFSDIGRSREQVLRGSALVRWLAEQRAVREMIGLYETLGRKHAPQVSREAQRWIERDTSRPYFAFLNYMDAHAPYLPPEPYASRFGGRADRVPVLLEELNKVERVDAERKRIEIAAYDGALAYLDMEVGRLIDTLRAHGALDNTIVIITADHGEEIGDHGRWGHAYSLHTEVVRVPLIIFGPGIPSGVRVAHPVSVRNIAATIAELTRLPGTPFPGISLALQWRQAAPADTALTEFGKFMSLYDGPYHYLRVVRGEGERLYDYAADPYERNDLSLTPTGRAETARIRARLAGMRSASASQDPGAPVLPIEK